MTVTKKKYKYINNRFKLFSFMKQHFKINPNVGKLTAPTGDLFNVRFPTRSR